MDKRPRSITVISWIFIAFGSIALLSGLLPYVDATAAHRIAEVKSQHPFEFWMAPIVRLVAVLCGVFMLCGFNWARWILVVWLGWHIILSLLHSWFELLVHSLLFAVVLYFLFRSQASAYFRGTGAPAAADSKGR
jgi:hypothetical protein